MLGDYVVCKHKLYARKAGLEQLRLVRYFDSGQQGGFRSLTDNFIWTATEIAWFYTQGCKSMYFLSLSSREPEDQILWRHWSNRNEDIARSDMLNSSRDTSKSRAV